MEIKSFIHRYLLDLKIIIIIIIIIIILLKTGDDLYPLPHQPSIPLHIKEIN
jgi:hypothetical protein